VNAGMDIKTIVMMRVYQMFGVAFLFVPIQTMTYVGVPMEKNNNISGMINLARNMGGSIGIAGLETILARRTQFHQSVLSANTADGHTFQTNLNAITQAMTHAGYDLSTATQMAYAQIYGMLQAQAAWLAYVDTIWLYSFACFAVVPLAFLMRRPKPGARPAAGGH
jgi:MFS transporter, DHA2 family, multidrug resistance protein